MTIHPLLKRFNQRIWLAVLMIAIFATTSLGQDNTLTGTGKISSADVTMPVPIIFDHLTTADGLSESTTKAIVQDELGFMWFATQYGLNKYDGYDFTIYTHDADDPTSLSDNDIHSLYLDREGILWVGTRNGGLNRMDRKTDTFRHYQHEPGDPSSLSGTFVQTIREDANGTLWVGTNQGLNRMDQQTNTFTRYLHASDDPHSLSHNNVFSLGLAANGDLWVGTAGGLCRFDNGRETFTCYRHDPNDPASLSDNNVFALYTDRSGTLWAGTRQGLNRVDTAANTFTRYQGDSANPHSLSDHSVFAIYEDRSRRFWVGTVSGGLYLLDRTYNTFTRYQHDLDDPTSISGNAVISILEDSSGSLWFGTWASSLNVVAPTRHKFPSSHPIPDPLSIQAADNRVWIGTFEEGLFEIDRATGTVRQFKHDPADPNTLIDNTIFALHRDQSGRLWIGTAGGLDRYDPSADQFEQPFAEAGAALGLETAIIRTITEDNRNQLWLGTQDGLFCLNIVTDLFDCYPRGAGGLPETINIYAIVPDKNGLFWLGTEVGLYRLNPVTQQIEPYNSDLSGVDASIRTITVDENDALWIGTWGSGLYYFDPITGEQRHYTRKNGLPSDLILGMEKDHQGQLWLSTSNGLVTFDPKDPTFRFYDTYDGLPEDGFNERAFFQSERGELYFGSFNHVITFSPGSIVDNSYVPPVVLTGFQLFNQPVTIGAASPLKQHPNFVTDLTLNHDQSVFSFEYAALNFTAPERNEYAYKMEGFDADWNYVGSRRIATYTNLRPGTYTFRVKASNNDGLWNEDGLSIRLTITPPWWQTWWAYTLYIVIGSTIILGYIHYRTQAHNRALAHERQLRETLERVDRSKDEERSRIAREMHDGLAQTLAGLRFRIRTWPNLMTLDPPRMTTEVHEVGTVLDETLQDLRRVIFALRPLMLSEMGFLSSVTHLAESVRQHNAIVIYTDITGDETQLSEILEHTAFRIIQEAFHNVVRHAQARYIWLRVTVDADSVEIEVRDDGVGFDTALLLLRARQGHQGILNLRERVAAHKGTTIITSHPGQGTTLHVRLPFKNQSTV